VGRGSRHSRRPCLRSIIDRSDGAEVSVTRARTRPAPVARDRIVFGRADGEILREAARQIRLREPRRDERILGYVTDLHREKDEVEGRATIKTLIDGQPRSLGMTLMKGDYDVAVQAHRERVPVTLVGDLEPEGQRWKLSEPRNLRLMRGGDE
jgi:hypothetical protein